MTNLVALLLIRQYEIDFLRFFMKKHHKPYFLENDHDVYDNQ
jgi:hypothetical protein